MHKGSNGYSQAVGESRGKPGCGIAGAPGVDTSRGTSSSGTRGEAGLRDRRGTRRGHIKGEQAVGKPGYGIAGGGKSGLNDLMCSEPGVRVKGFGEAGF